MYLISIYFDEKTNRIWNRHIKKIAQETGNDFMISHEVPPHMTISSIEARGVEVLEPALRSLQGKIKKGKVSFVSVGQMFPYVFYGTPVLNRYLQDLSIQVYEVVKDIPETSVSRFYRPYSWLPHVTIGKTLGHEQMQIAFSVMQQAFQPFQGVVTEIGLARVNPHKDVLKFELL